MERERIDPPGLYAHPAFSRVVTVSGDAKLVFIAGQTSVDENNDPVAPGDLRGQYVQVMTNLDIALRAAGATWDDIVFRRVFALDPAEYSRVAREVELPDGVGGGRAASTLIGVSSLSNPELLLEIDVMAAVAR